MSTLVEKVQSVLPNAPKAAVKKMTEEIHSEAHQVSAPFLSLPFPTFSMS